MATSPESEHPIKAYGYAARDTSGLLSPLTFSRRATGETDVRFKVLYCGICHSDLHIVKNEWGYTNYPVTPGHEIVGVVTEVGSKVEKFKIGDKVGVGCLVGSCRSCQSCASDYEQDCLKQVFTYGVPNFDGTQTYGGYSDHMVSDEHFVLRWPENLPLDSGAPLLCAGITTYSPLRYFGLDKPGTKVGVVGLGGLGHVAVKMAKAFGAEVTVFSTTSAKEQDAIEGLKADHFINSKDEHQMEVHDYKPEPVSGSLLQNMKSLLFGGSSHESSVQEDRRREDANQFAKGDLEAYLIKHGIRESNSKLLKIRLGDIKLATDNFSETYIISSNNYYNLYRAELYHYDIENPSSVKGENKGKHPERQNIVTIKRFLTNRFRDDPHH